MTLTKRASVSSQLASRRVGDGRAGALVVLGDEVVQRALVVGVHRVEADELHVAAPAEAAVDVEHVGDAAAHARREVAAGRAEHDDAPAGHVLAAVVADALDDRVGARVAHGEALAGEAVEERAALGGAVEHGVADEHVLLGGEGRLVGRAHGDDAAGEALGGVVVGVADQRQLDAGRQPGAERLARRSAEGQLRRALGQPVDAPHLRHGARQDAADGAVDVADSELAGHRAAMVDRLLAVGDQVVVERPDERRRLRHRAAQRRALRHVHAGAAPARGRRRAPSSARPRARSRAGRRGRPSPRRCARRAGP